MSHSPEKKNSCKCKTGKLRNSSNKYKRHKLHLMQEKFIMFALIDSVLIFFNKTFTLVSQSQATVIFCNKNNKNATLRLLCDIIISIHL